MIGADSWPFQTHVAALFFISNGYFFLSSSCSGSKVDDMLENNLSEKLGIPRKNSEGLVGIGALSVALIFDQLAGTLPRQCTQALQH